MTFWRDTEIALARQLKGQHRTITEIAAALGRSQLSVQNFFRHTRKRTDYWTDAETEILLREYGLGKSSAEISEMLPGRTPVACNGRLDYIRFKRGQVQIRPSIQIPHDVLAERERRLNEPRTLTAMLCGDPPFSQSALASRPALGRDHPKAEKAYEGGPTYLDPALAV